ncbi:hypothetical protein [Paraconexibacter sp.]|uniref:hypothetical protein n=1 Tax=Paraconexibacter sp. TaxID=2949640 RepID=UPI00356ABE68
MPVRGTMMGNRGCLVDADGRLHRRWQGERWIICVLEFAGRVHHPLMSPRHYTHLFFLDEATACAAGHRPCFECRRPAARAFVDAWWSARPGRDGSLRELDTRLHRERTALASPPVDCGELPDGVMVARDGRAWLVRGDALLPWSHEGYGEPVSRQEGPVAVLTPPSTVAAMRQGWQPELHPSAG